MFKNYLKIALRNLGRYKAYSLINIMGMAVGMACCILILLFIQNELSHDKYHTKSDRIFRLAAINTSSGQVSYYAPIGAPVAEMFSEALPEIENFTRFNQYKRTLVEFDQKKFFEERFFFADPSVFDVFSFAILGGDPKAALTSPFTIVITNSVAQKYFPDENPIGKTLIVDNEHSYQIQAVLEEVPQNSHFQFDFLASLETLADLYGDRYLTHPGYMSFYTYLLLKENTDAQAMEQKFQELILAQYGEQIAAMRSFFLQPLKSIHLHSRLEFEIEPNASFLYIYIYAAIAFLILLIASFNFMNLSTARSARRAKEVGLRKVLGAFRGQLFKQFLGESLLLAMLSFVLAILLVYIFLGWFNSLTGKAIYLNLIQNQILLLSFAGIVFAVGILAGLYPALFLSAFEPIRTLKGKLGLSGRSGLFRHILVVAQFTISIALIIGTFVIQKQLRYMRGQDLGFDKEQVVIIPLHDQNTRDVYAPLKTEISQISSVIGVSASSSVPGKPVTSIAHRGEEFKAGEYWSFDTFFVDYDFLETLGLEISAGRNFSQEFPTDQAEAFIVNETAVQRLGWTDPLGELIIWPSDLRRADAIVKQGQVIGVVKDFHITSLHENVSPVVMHIFPSNYRYISVRITSENIPETLAALESTFNTYSPAFPFEYSFLDEDFDRLYKADEKVGQIILIFSSLAILVACLGLFGLSAFSAEQRTREIGIRKVLGASASGITLLLTKEFAKWVVLANLFAWPLAYFAMQRWLQNFAYRVNIGADGFIFAALIAFAIALITISYQSIRAALANPIDSLRYE